MSRQRTLVLLTLFCAAFFAVVGCGSKNPAAPASISGGVSIKGKTLTGGTVQFVPASGPSYSSSISLDGTYAIADLPTGEMIITVETESLNPEKKAASGKDADRRNAMMGQRKAPGGQSGGSSSSLEPQYMKIPDKYSKSKTSPLTYTVKHGRQVYSIELE